MLIPEDKKYHPKNKLVFGRNTISQLGALAGDICSGSVLIVTDPGVEKAGHVASAVDSLKDSGFSVTVFNGVIENPTTQEVEKCVQVARAVQPNLIVGLGGGSSMDTAKGCNFLYTNDGIMADYWGVNKASKPMLPLIAIPTTAGTGSECQSFALICDSKSHRKMACGDEKALPVISLLDPVLTLSQPRSVAAATGIDAVCHAIESAVTKKRNDVSAYYAKASLKQTINALPKVLTDHDDIEARENMLLGATYAGIAIENSMLGAAHACANPLTVTLGVVHGYAVAMMLPAVVRYNAKDDEAATIYRELAVYAGLVSEKSTNEKAIDALLDRIESIIAVAEAPVANVGDQINQAMIVQLAKDAAQEWTGTFNPRDINEKEFELLYRDTFNV